MRLRIILFSLVFKKTKTQLFHYLQVADIEENCWSPRYGLKGKIDVTGKFRVRSCDGSNEMRKLLIPVEVKTGRDSHSMEHIIQVRQHRSVAAASVVFVCTLSV